MQICLCLHYTMKEVKFHGCFRKYLKQGSIFEIESSKIKKEQASAIEKGRMEMRRFLSAVLIFTILLTVLTVSAAAEPPKSQDLVILYTNDVHGYIDEPLGYSVLKHIREDLEQQYAYVLLVDGGDHIQGTAYGAMDQGEHIITLMNAAGYDAATLGNHEFDYGMDRCEQLRAMADFPYLDCNFFHEKNGARGKNVLDSFQIFPMGSEKVAIVGVLTPESFTKSTPAFFQDEDGNYIYGISAGADGSGLYADVQKAVDDAKDQGATWVVGLGHLGVDPASEPYTSKAVIRNVTGLNVFIDGHSHTEVPGEWVEDPDGNQVMLTQSGSCFDHIGMVILHQDGSVDTDFITAKELLDGEDEVTGYTLESQFYHGSYEKDPEVESIQQKWIREIQQSLGRVIGRTNLKLDNFREGTRLVRSQETNTGDFTADALYWLFDSLELPVDGAVSNGGGIRNQAPVTGEISYLTCKEIHTFNNVACLQSVTGQQLLDALEWGARVAGTGEECGGFLQVSGICYEIDPSIKDTTEKDAKGVWTGPPAGAYRVHDVKIYNKERDRWDPLNLQKTYHLAGYNYTLRNGGDGFQMFAGAKNDLDFVMEDYMVLASYIEDFPDAEIKAENSPLMKKYPALKVNYGQVDGSGRIVFSKAETESPWAVILLTGLLSLSAVVLRKKQS